MATVRIGDLAAKIKKADAGHYYINIFQKDGKFKSTHIKLTGAEKMFQKDPHFVYVRSIRHAGNRTDLHAYLTAAGFKESDIKAHLNDSYTNDNFAKMQKEYQKELGKAPVMSPRAKVSRQDLSTDYILRLGKAMEGFKFENKPRATSPVPVTPKPAATGGKMDLKTRLSSLSEDKVLDISSFDAEKKSGIKTVKKPTKSLNRKNVGNTADLKKIYFDFSKPVENGIAALVFLGFTQERATKIMRDPSHTRGTDLNAFAVGKH